jgi:hypothetical protein
VLESSLNENVNLNWLFTGKDEMRKSKSSSISFTDLSMNDLLDSAIDTIKAADVKSIYKLRFCLQDINEYESLRKEIIDLKSKSHVHLNEKNSYFH